MSASPKPFHKPPSLRQLAERNDGPHDCLCRPFPYKHRRCTKQVTVSEDVKEELEDTLRTGHLTQFLGLRESISRLSTIAESYCCQQCKVMSENMRDFAHYWMISELFDDFLSQHKWSWHESEWRCQASASDSICRELKNLTTAPRDTVYRSLYRIAFYTYFADGSNYLKENFLDSAIADLVQLWLCANHKKDRDILEAIQATMKEKILDSASDSSVSHSQPSDDQHGDVFGPSPTGDAESCSSLLSPDRCISSTQHKAGAMDMSTRRRSAPGHLSGSAHVPSTPDRPIPIRSSASDTTNLVQYPSDQSPSLGRARSENSATRLSNTGISPEIPGKIIFDKYSSEEWHSRTIFNEVLRLINHPARNGKEHHGVLYRRGWIYILTDSEHYPGYVKIGRTVNSVVDRQKQIASCNKMVLQIVGAENQSWMPYHERLEAIIHADLVNERRNFECSCSAGKKKKNSDGSHVVDKVTQHGEWFEIEVDKAIRVVERWSNWMRGEMPYVEEGQPGAGELRNDYKRRVAYFWDRRNVPEDSEKRWEQFQTPLYLAEAISPA